MNRNRPNRISLRAVLSVGLVVACSSMPRQSVGQLWGIQPATNRIVRVDPVSGNVLSGFTPPGGLLQPTQQFGGLSIAEHGNTLIYQNPVANPTSLFRINPDTGALLSTEFMPATAPPEFRAGLSYQSGAGLGGLNAIYAINDGSPVQRQDGYSNSTLVNHTPSGATFAGALGGDDTGRAFLAFGTGIIEFDPFNVNVTIRNLPAPIGAAVGGLAFDGQFLYLSDLNGRLFTLNPNTGAVLRNVVVSTGPLIGLAARIPEPGTAITCAICVALIFSTRWMGGFGEAMRWRPSRSIGIESANKRPQNASQV